MHQPAQANPNLPALSLGPMLLSQHTSMRCLSFLPSSQKGGTFATQMSAQEGGIAQSWSQDVSVSNGINGLFKQCLEYLPINPSINKCSMRSPTELWPLSKASIMFNPAYILGNSNQLTFLELRSNQWIDLWCFSSFPLRTHIARSTHSCTGVVFCPSDLHQ